MVKIKWIVYYRQTILIFFLPISYWKPYLNFHKGFHKFPPFILQGPGQPSESENPNKADILCWDDSQGIGKMSCSLIQRNRSIAGEFSSIPINPLRHQWPYLQEGLCLVLADTLSMKTTPIPTGKRKQKIMEISGRLSGDEKKRGKTLIQNWADQWVGQHGW